MEVNLKREAIQYCTPVYSDTLSREETLETVVSDTLPDVARILDVDAAVYLRSKTLLQGSIRIEGSIRGTVLYIGEDSERLQRIEAELPVSFSAEAEGTEDTDILAGNLGGRQAFKPAEDPVSRRGLRRGRGVSQRDGGAPDRGGADAGTLYADRHKNGQLSLRHRGEELSCLRRGRDKKALLLDAGAFSPASRRRAFLSPTRQSFPPDARRWKNCSAIRIRRPWRSSSRSAER